MSTFSVPKKVKSSGARAYQLHPFLENQGAARTLESSLLNVTRDHK